MQMKCSLYLIFSTLRKVYIVLVERNIDANTVKEDIGSCHGDSLDMTTERGMRRQNKVKRHEFVSYEFGNISKLLKT